MKQKIKSRTISEKTFKSLTCFPKIAEKSDSQFIMFAFRSYKKLELNIFLFWN